MAIPRELIERIVPSLTERLGMPLVLGGELVSLRTKLPRVARSDAPVLLRGPCGAEKERVARAVHYLSCRAAFPFITITCGKLTEEGLRRALFGPEATPADLLDPGGLVRAAAGGTLFLDEVEHLGAAVQGRLLRWLRGRAPGESRVICGTHADLWKLVEQGSFRPELYYRINVISLILLSSVAEKWGAPISPQNVASLASEEGDSNELGEKRRGLA